MWSSCSSASGVSMRMRRWARLTLLGVEAEEEFRFSAPLSAIFGIFIDTSSPTSMSYTLSPKPVSTLYCLQRREPASPSEDLSLTSIQPAGFMLLCGYLPSVHNTSQAASVEFIRLRRTNCARSRRATLSENSKGIFDRISRVVPQILQALPGPAGYQEAADGQSGTEKAQEDHPPLKGRHLAEVGKDAVSQQHRHDARKGAGPPRDRFLCRCQYASWVRPPLTWWVHYSKERKLLSIGGVSPFCGKPWL